MRLKGLWFKASQGKSFIRPRGKWTGGVFQTRKPHKALSSNPSLTKKMKDFPFYELFRISFYGFL
jgi:hypothetical protein